MALLQRFLFFYTDAGIRNMWIKVDDGKQGLDNTKFHSINQICEEFYSICITQKKGSCEVP